MAKYIGGNVTMRTTVILPDELLKQVMKITHIKTKTGVIIYALKNLIWQESIQGLKDYRGKLHLDIDPDHVRSR